MYQSVGHEAIEYIPGAIGDVPLFRSEISGTSVSTELTYGVNVDDSYNKNDEVILNCCGICVDF